MSFPLLTIITFLPLLGAVVILFLPKNNERLIKSWAVAISIVPLLLSVYLWFAYDQSTGSYQFEELLPWIPQLGASYHMGVDGLSVPLIFLTTLLTTLGLWYSMRVIKVRVREFFLLFLLLEMGMLGVFVALDFVLFYVFWEIGLVPMYFLIAIWGQAKDRPQYAAIKFFLYTLVCSVAMLLAILGIYFATGTFDIVRAAELKPFANDMVLGSLAFWAFFLAFAIKVPSFPFHTWLPDAHTRHRRPARSSWPVFC
jgi:NADH-quinone oxidoreductase subunit M